MSRIEAVIFDWAGTTVDYGCFAPVQVFIEVFRHVGIEPTMDEVRAPMGMLKRDHIKTMLEWSGFINFGLRNIKESLPKKILTECMRFMRKNY